MLKGFRDFILRGNVVDLAVAVVVAVSVCLIWAKPVPHALKAAALSVGSVMVTPYLLAYDLCILSVTSAFLVRDGISRGFLPGERLTLLICSVGMFLLLRPTVPVVPIVCTVMLLLVARRVIAWRREHSAGSILR